MIVVAMEKIYKSKSGNHRVKADFTLEVGQMLGLLGPSGSGKTTILRCLAGLEKPDGGLIKKGSEHWFHSDDRIMVPPQKRRVAYMFQDHALFPAMTALDNVRYSGVSVARAMEMLDLVQMAPWAKAYPRRLSGGQSQRIALARALAMEPDLLLLDEPLSALDQDLRLSLGDEIRRLQKQLGVCTIMVSHGVGELERLCDRIVTIGQ